MKSRRSQEAVIGGYTAPRGSRKYLGALLLGYYQDGILVFAGHCGSGFDDHGLSSLKAELDALRISRSPFMEEPHTNSLPIWVEPILVCEVSFAGWTRAGLMRQPVFVGLRDDKDAREVVREITERVKRPSVRNAGIRPDISNPDKLFWPQDRITKRDMVDYYDRISDIILPYLADRPESLHRFPDGIAGEGFYQKNLNDFPPYIATIPIRSESEGKTVNYLLCQDKATLLYMANLGCIELNPWSSRIGNIDNPDYLILDIDPQDVGFQDVVKVALASYNMLQKAGITSYCKTSGATGLHICVPLGAKYNYDEVREFAHLLNLLVNRRLPGLTSLARRPDSRRNKVYLDYLQNRRGQTLAAPYSLRPRPGAPVSAPLRWSEVGLRLNPGNFHIKNILSRIKKIGDPWAGVLGPGIDMLTAIDKLENINRKI